MANQTVYVNNLPEKVPKEGGRSLQALAAWQEYLYTIKRLRGWPALL